MSELRGGIQERVTQSGESPNAARLDWDESPIGGLAPQRSLSQHLARLADEFDHIRNTIAVELAAPAWLGSGG